MAIVATVYYSWPCSAVLASAGAVESAAAMAWMRLSAWHGNEPIDQSSVYQSLLGDFHFDGFSERRMLSHTSRRCVIVRIMLSCSSRDGGLRTRKREYCMPRGIVESQQST